VKASTREPHFTVISVRVKPNARASVLEQLKVATGWLSKSQPVDEKATRNCCRCCPPLGLPHVGDPKKRKLHLRGCAFIDSGVGKKDVHAQARNTISMRM
jgi:hypothetical protein